jgi:transposase-like protein
VDQQKFTTNKMEGYAVNKSTSIWDFGRESVKDALTEVLRNGAKKLLLAAVEEELENFLKGYASLRLSDGRLAVVRNGHLPTRTIQTGIGNIEVQVPKVRDRSGRGVKFNSALLPPYLKRTKSVEELLPWLYLKGISTGEYQEALHSILGDDASGLSATTISRLKSKWQEEHREWSHRDLSTSRYVYWWADGIYSNVRMDDKLCLLVIIGATEEGKKELVAVEDGFRESADSWYSLLTDLRSRGMLKGPSLAVGDAALGFWKALSQIYPQTRHQRCWVHKTANVLNKLPKSMQDKVKCALHDIWMSESRSAAETAFDLALEKYGVKYASAMECLRKDKSELLTFYDFPAEHWTHIRTSNPIESAFSSIRLRTAKTRNCGSRETALSMIFKLAQSAEKRWRKLQGHKLLGEVITGIRFKDGIRDTGTSDSRVA